MKSCFNNMGLKTDALLCIDLFSAIVAKDV